MRKQRDERVLYDEDDEELTKEELGELKQKLLEERERVKERLARHREDANALDTGPLTDEVDQASQASDHAYFARLIDKEGKLLKRIDHALQKFETGEYGLCEGTGEPINKKRLMLRPWTRYSIEHKEHLERQRLRGRQR